MSMISIANPTLQKRELKIQVGKPDAGKILTLHIPPGGQALFHKEVEGLALEAVLRQIRNAGGILPTDLKTARNRFTLLYTVFESKKKDLVSSEAIDEGLKRDEEIRQDLSNKALEVATSAAFVVNEEVGAKEVAMEITEVDDRGTVEGGATVEVVAGHKRTPRGGRATERKGK